MLSEYLEKQFIIYSEKNDTFINAWHKFNRWLQIQHQLRESCGVFSWHSFHIYFSKVDIGQKKYSAEKIEAHSLLKITQLSNQPVIINASF